LWNERGERNLCVADDVGISRRKGLCKWVRGEHKGLTEMLGSSRLRKKLRVVNKARAVDPLPSSEYPWG